MQECFANAFYLPTPTVLGRKLKPLCLAHVHLLMAAESPYALGGDTRLEHLVFAVAVCSRTWEECLAWLPNEGLTRECEEWGKSAIAKCDLIAAGQLFADYMEQHSIAPRRWQSRPGRNGGGYKHPWPLIVATALLHRVGESRAWNMPIPLALSYWSAILEIEHGDESLESEQDDRLRKLRVSNGAS